MELLKLLHSMVEKIEEKNLVQVVIDSASSVFWIGQKLMEARKNMFWVHAPLIASITCPYIGDLSIHRDTLEK